MSPAEAKRTFADLMARARDRKLSLTEKARLFQARQMLRRGRRPAMNPRPPGEYQEFSTAKYTTQDARLQILGLRKQGWDFLKTVVYPSGKINFHLTHDGKTAVLNEDGSIDMLYPVGTKVFDSLKNRDVTQGYGARPNRPAMNPARFPHGRHLVELKKIRMGGIPFAFVVIRDGEEIGFITKHRDTRTETHPWKAFVGIGHHATYLGAVYGSDGKARAIQAIVDGIPLEENPIELGYRSPKTGRGRHVSIGVGRSVRSNPSRSPQRIGRALEVRYRRDIGQKPGYYKHEIKSKAGVYTVSPGWVYVGSKSILITEGKPRV